MTLLMAVALVISHLGCGWMLWRALRRGAPLASEWLIVSFVLYYDLGLALEALGVESRHFRALLRADAGDLALILCYLTAGPWLVHSGFLLTGPHARLPWRLDRPTRRKAWLAALVLAVDGVLLGAVSMPRLLSGAPLYTLRSNLGSGLGAFVILLYVPLGVLVFLATRQELRSRRGMALLIGQAVVASLVALPIGQRTLVLLPWLMLGLTRLRLSWPNLIALAVAGVVIAAGLAWVFKVTPPPLGSRLSDVVLVTLGADFSRAGPLREALELARPIGTRLWDTPLAGYRYAALFYVPRTLAPGKGQSTAGMFTARLTGSDPRTLNWGYGLGLIEEIMLNAGTLAVVPGLFIYGLALGLLERLARRWRAAYLPLMLAVIALCGYHLSALVLVYGTLFLICVALSLVFEGQAAAASALEGGAA